ncbi:MAG: hypothetical protein A2499_08135 [Stygiobacter sp. RIFOXYC12_FULL_38_8]|nr:MAG: hypothetical protein A2X62_05330 [Stygiobacter sp. GWC2_38_9]OGU78777.1 MAG: hypothetical protein A2279_04090 [Stygiobacter sp. RIFOXYA12_FULL_38_9]OGV07343.1 MAG: hypothetical protein A2299_04660 [Stygiobacter sp. RIFOXYB2_FULL_37_11]OGV15864.1 MAG: hypothetical protein A2440_01895 [Stygiobacter sp. RIFOXYC2_FULL_38_25]OGV28379.1 MAG: hypothetical protein A2499_08135 [Stygiobacter sp. RIFOXYC12_FULL_38_8]OGV80994.1 MAG: hypothetical protein A2X65_06945 [Stygiobacter sp. GWF2_38_21]
MGSNKSPVLGLILQIVIVFIGIVAFVLMLWEPHLEGRNAYSTLYEVYFNDPFLAFAYVASIPFYLALYNALKVTGYYRQNNFVSQAAIKYLRTIKYCGISMIGFAVVGEIIIMLNESDDRAGGVVMGILIIIVAVVIAVAAAKFERNLQNALDEIVLS